MRETTSYRRTTNPAQIPTEEEEVYKRKLGHMQSEIMLLKTQHQLELETLRKQLTTLKRGKRKKGRETNADGVSDDHVVSKDKDDINFNTLPQICDNTLAHGPISASSRAFLVLKNLHNIQRNLHALQHLQSDLDTGAPTAAHSPMGMSEASESESAAWAAADSMRKVIEELTAAVISETCKWVSVPVSTAAIKPFKTILERYRSHLGLIQGEDGNKIKKKQWLSNANPIFPLIRVECCPFLPSESQHIMSVYRALERSWEQLISFYFDTTTAATKHDSILYLYLLILESVFGLLLNNPELVMEAKETLPLLALPAPQYTHFCPQYSVTIAYFLRTALEVIVRQMKLVVEMESSGWASASSSQASSSFSTAATTALSFAPRAAKATRSVTQDKSMTRLHAAHFSLRAKNHSQQIKEGCGWIMRQLLDALKTPTTRQLIQHALNADQSRRGE
ncbi:hypothetical protein BG004_007521 [Podila humilis]|nr:hypothetical protein BG004_007521 [Podila humilis]